MVLPGLIKLELRPRTSLMQPVSTMTTFEESTSPLVRLITQELCFLLGIKMILTDLKFLRNLSLNNRPVISTNFQWITSSLRTQDTLLSRLVSRVPELGRQWSTPRIRPSCSKTSTFKLIWRCLLHTFMDLVIGFQASRWVKEPGPCGDMTRNMTSTMAVVANSWPVCILSAWSNPDSPTNSWESSLEVPTRRHQSSATTSKMQFWATSLLVVTWT